MKRQVIKIRIFLFMVSLVVLSNSFSLKRVQELEQKSRIVYYNNLKEDKNAGQFLEGVKFQGKYHVQGSQNLFNYLESQEGRIDIFFTYDSESQFNNLDFHPNVVILEMFDPQYMDQKVALLSVPLLQIGQNSTWQSSVSKLNTTLFFKQSVAYQFQSQNVNFSIQAFPIQSQNNDQIQIHFKMNGNENVNFRADATIYQSLIPNIGYSLFMTFLICIQIVCGFFLIKNMEMTNYTLGAKISLITLCICTIQDFSAAMIHIQQIMYLTSSFFMFLLPSFAYVLLLIGIDMRLIFGTWRGHNMNQFNDFRSLRKKLTMFYLKFYLGLFGYMVLMYFFGFDWWFIALRQLYLLPQIIRNARKGIDPGFNKLYAIGFIGTRYLLLVYNRYCPNNYFKLVPMPAIVISLCCMYLFNLVILYAQHKVGARFFIPKQWQPNYFNYYEQMTINESNMDSQCAICLQGIFQKNDQLNSSGFQLQKQMVDKADVMKTPCNHIFHEQCLKQWIAVKLQCPSCRSPLPILL